MTTVAGSGGVQRAIVLSILALAVVASLGVVGSKALFRREFDLGGKPPDQVFARIFRSRVPTGVADLQVAGEAHLSGEFWMRFRAKNIDAVVKALGQNHVVEVSALAQAPSAMPTPQDILKSRYADAAGWKQVLSIARPQYLEFSTKPEGTGRFGVLVLDRARHTVYSHGDLL